ncbi:serine/threonine-protein kinase [Acrasis kona]|uniref:Serine/threonine-protein kinase n=1 Tax=Acrasis kona TaxID=1008807 RepID=A0AAW2ZK93_9EUKA
MSGKESPSPPETQTQENTSYKKQEEEEQKNEKINESANVTPQTIPPPTINMQHVNPAMHVYTQHLMNYLSAMGANTTVPNGAIPMIDPASMAMMSPFFPYSFQPQAVPMVPQMLPNATTAASRKAIKNNSNTSFTEEQPQDTTPMNILYPSHRFWKLEFATEQAKQEVDGDAIEMSITMKIRGEEASQYVPERLYSSHKYVIQHEVSGELLVQKYPLIVAKLQIIDPVSRQKIVNSSKGPKKEDVVKGTPEAALTHEGALHPNSITGSMRIQFTDVSYRHEKGHFAMLISYYNPASLQEPLFNLMSPAFKVFARKPTDKNPTETLKPNKHKPNNRKRKSETSSQQSSTEQDLANTPQNRLNVSPPVIMHTPHHMIQQPLLMQQSSSPPPPQQIATENIEPSSKRQKQHSAVFSEFNKKLEQLAAMKERLNESDKKIANEFSLEKLLSIDPDFTIDFFLKNENAQNIAGMNNSIAQMLMNATANGNQVEGQMQAEEQEENENNTSTGSASNHSAGEFLNEKNFDSEQ